MQSAPLQHWHWKRDALNHAARCYAACGVPFPTDALLQSASWYEDVKRELAPMIHVISKAEKVAQARHGLPQDIVSRPAADPTTACSAST
jgi:hypothetical protein